MADEIQVQSLISVLAAGIETLATCRLKIISFKIVQMGGHVGIASRAD